MARLVTGGLSGMRERAAGMRARLAIRSKCGAGTEIELRVPACVAYADLAANRRRFLQWKLSLRQSEPR